MAENDKGLILAKEAERIINTKLIQIEAKLRKSDKMPFDELMDLVLEANSLILMISDEDPETYETWKYRLFVNPDGNVYLTQGLEVDTDYQPDNYRPLDEE